MSLNEIREHLQTAHDEAQGAMNAVKTALDVHLNRAHVAVGAASAAGLEMAELNEIAGLLTSVDNDGTGLVEKLSAAIVKIAEIGSL